MPGVYAGLPSAYRVRFFFRVDGAERLGISGVWPQRRATPPSTGGPAHRLRLLPTASGPRHPLVGRAAYRGAQTRAGQLSAMACTSRALSAPQPGIATLDVVPQARTARASRLRRVGRCTQPTATGQGVPQADAPPLTGCPDGGILMLRTALTLVARPRVG